MYNVLCYAIDRAVRHNSSAEEIYNGLHTIVRAYLIYQLENAERVGGTSAAQLLVEAMRNGQPEYVLQIHEQLLAAQRAGLPPAEVSANLQPFMEVVSFGARQREVVGYFDPTPAVSHSSHVPEVVGRALDTLATHIDAALMKGQLLQPAIVAFYQNKDLVVAVGTAITTGASVALASRASTGPQAVSMRYIEIGVPPASPAPPTWGEQLVAALPYLAVAAGIIGIGYGLYRWCYSGSSCPCEPVSDGTKLTEVSSAVGKNRPSGSSAGKSDVASS